MASLRGSLNPYAVLPGPQNRSTAILPGPQNQSTAILPGPQNRSTIAAPPPIAGEATMPTSGILPPAGTDLQTPAPAAQPNYSSQQWRPTPTAGGGTGSEYGINWGNVVNDPAERARILGLATDAANRNEAGSGLGGGTYGPGMSREQAIRDFAYGFFPQSSGGGSSGGGAPGTPGAGGTPGGGFADRAPTSTPYGDFTAPDPTKVTEDLYYQFRAKEGQKAIERSAAARGTLLGGGTLKALESYRQGLASEEGQNAFNRAFDVYGTNRATNAQNFGQQMDTFGGNLAGFNANTSANLGYGNLDLGRQRLALEAEFGRGDRARDIAQEGQQRQDAYTQQVEADRRAYNERAAADNAAANANASAEARRRAAEAEAQRRPPAPRYGDRPMARR